MLLGMRFSLQVVEDSLSLIRKQPLAYTLRVLNY